MDLSRVVNIIIALLIAIDIHELSHALVATWLGDSTPRDQGHISLNPFRHMDQFGIIMLFIMAISGFGFTYGFTPVNERNLRYGPRLGGAIVAVAGPLSNLVLATIVALGLHFFLGAQSIAGSIYFTGGNQKIDDLLATLLWVNVTLTLINIIPLPPLDGWRIFSTLLSPRMLFDLRGIIQYGPMILFVIFIFNPQLHLLDNTLYPAMDGLQTALIQL